MLTPVELQKKREAREADRRGVRAARRRAYRHEERPVVLEKTVAPEPKVRVVPSVSVKAVQKRDSMLARAFKTMRRVFA